MVADVRLANGSDNNFVNELFKYNLCDDNFYGYAAWNTSANTLGSLISCAKMKYLSSSLNKESFRKLQITRFLDDWAYQANTRQMLLNPDVKGVKEKMRVFEQKISGIYSCEVDAEYSFPWNRLFEIEVKL